MDESGRRSDDGDDSVTPERTDRDETGRQDERDRRDATTDNSARFASTAVWLTLIIVGLFLTIFALGRAFGLDLFALFEEALQTEMGQYLLLALVGILLIIVAQRGLTSS
ncbi:hypothetical protein ACKVMT_12250 [Halobacteriales archaeon Cl-PHB]